MAGVQAEDVSASLQFVCDLNDLHQEWLSSTTTNSHGQLSPVPISWLSAQLIHVVEHLT